MAQAAKRNSTVVPIERIKGKSDAKAEAQLSAFADLEYGLNDAYDMASIAADTLADMLSPSRAESKGDGWTRHHYTSEETDRALFALWHSLKLIRQVKEEFYAATKVAG